MSREILTRTKGCPLKPNLPTQIGIFLGVTNPPTEVTVETGGQKYTVTDGGTIPGLKIDKMVKSDLSGGQCGARWAISNGSYVVRGDCYQCGRIYSATPERIER